MTTSSHNHPTDPPGNHPTVPPGTGSQNPARLSAGLQSLFPPAVVAAELTEAGDPSLLLPAEAEFLGRAVRKRAQEFAAGRLCARRALTEFGFAEFPIRAARDRQPVWPLGMTGSITHTDGYCAAVAAERRVLAGIGIDSEVIGRVTTELWHQVCLPEESDWLGSLEEPLRAMSATLLFAAKEAFYKCQYPLTGEWLNFEDIRVTLPAPSAARGVFAVAPMRRLAVLERDEPWSKSGKLPSGCYRFHDGLVTAGIAFPAA